MIFNQGSGGANGIKLASIAITHAPTKTAYNAGETFDTTGMVVTATYTNGATLAVGGYTVNPQIMTMGTTSVTITYTEGGVSKTATQAVTVTKNKVPVPTVSGTLTYNGETQFFRFNNEPAWNIAAKDGDVGAKDAGSYTTTFTLYNTDLYEWADGSGDTYKEVTTQIDKVTPTVTAPTKEADMTYNGSSRDLTATAGSTNYGTLQYSTDGTNWSTTRPTATNAGSYTVRYRVVGDSNINSVASTSIGTVEIARKTPTLTLSPTSVTLNTSTTSQSVSITYDGDGTLSVSSNNTSVATASRSGNTITISSVNNTSGSATVTVSVTAGTNYTSASKTVSVTASFIVTKTFANLTDSEVNQLAKAISNDSTITNTTSTVTKTIDDWKCTVSIGDTRDYTLDGTSYAFRVMGFNHYALTSSTAYGSTTATGNAGILIQMVGCFNTKKEMKSSMTSSDGWRYSDLRTWMNDTMLGYLPSATQSAIKKVTIYTAKTVSDATLISSADKLFLPAEVEVFGSATNAKGGTNEGTRYAWYKSNDTTAKRVKKVNGSADGWWERSPYNWSGSSFFCRVNSTGNAGYSNASISQGVAPCFCF